MTRQRDYEFHPIAEEYPLMPALELGRLEEGMREAGYDEDKPIVLYDGKILDGRNRYLAAKAAEVKPTFRTFKGAEQEARRFAQRANEERRHLATEWLQRRRQERIERVAAARQEGQSTRAIAEAEGISQPQVLRDLQKATDTGVSVETPNGQVEGKDGKKRPAKQSGPKPILCDRCARVGAVRDCPECKKAREAKGVDATGRKPKKPKKKPETREELRDKVGNVLPDGACRDAFADTQLAGLILDMQQVESMFATDPWIAKAGKLTDHYGFIRVAQFRDHLTEAAHAFGLAIAALQDGLPYAVCPKCKAEASKRNGTVCSACRGLGHVPEHRYQELSA